MDKNKITSPEQMLRKIKQRKFLLISRPWIRFFIACILIAVLIIGIGMIPYVHIYGIAMEPTLSDGDLGIAFPAKVYNTGDIVAFRHGEKILTRRIIAGPGSTVVIDENGMVTVDGVTLDEPYLTRNAMGQYNVSFPYVVPEGQYFVLGDNRSVAVDSRSTVLGCISKDVIIGRLVVVFWPFSRFQWNPSEASVQIGGTL